MKWYFASRIRHKDTIKSLGQILKKHGHQFSFDWSSLPSLKPYKDHAKDCRELANSVGESLKDTDIFVLISDEAGTDMFIEIGIAIGINMANKNLKIYNVGPHNQRSLMQFYPSINGVDTLEEIFVQHLPAAVPDIKILDQQLAQEFKSE